MAFRSLLEFHFPKGQNTQAFCSQSAQSLLKTTSVHNLIQPPSHLQFQQRLTQQHEKGLLC